MSTLSLSQRQWWCWAVVVGSFCPLIFHRARAERFRFSRRARIHFTLLARINRRKSIIITIVIRLHIYNFGSFHLQHIQHILHNIYIRIYCITMCVVHMCVLACDDRCQKLHNKFAYRTHIWYIASSSHNMMQYMMVYNRNSKLFFTRTHNHHYIHLVDG